MGRWEEFDYVVVNDDLGQAIEDLEAVLAGKGASHATKNTALRARAGAIIDL
jgi:guanylate kinase